MIAAIEFSDLLIQQAAQLDGNPMLGRVGRVNGTRELVAHPNYISVYRLVGNVAEVLRVKHTSQKLP